MTRPVRIAAAQPASSAADTPPDRLPPPALGDQGQALLTEQTNVSCFEHGIRCIYRGTMPSTSSNPSALIIGNLRYAAGLDYARFPALHR